MARLFDSPVFPQAYLLSVFIPDTSFAGMSDLLPMLASLFLIFIAMGTISWRLYAGVKTERDLIYTKYDFMNNMAHEFKTPLTNIRLATETLKKQPAGSMIPGNELVDIIHEENQRIQGNIDLILESARLEKDEISIDKQWVRASDFINNCVAPFHLQLGADKVVAIEVDLAEDKIYLDPRLTSKALENIIDNAIKYGRGDEKPDISIRVSESSYRYTIAIQDNGQGISPLNLKRIFEKYHRVNNQVQHDVKGFGLGLYFAKKIMEMQRGDIQVSSKIGSGSVFTLWLPKNNSKNGK